MKTIKKFNEFVNENSLPEDRSFHTKTRKFFDDILEGGSEEEALDRARGLDWSEVESSEETYPYLDYIDTVNGVGVWYNYGHNAYYFSDETENE